MINCVIVDDEPLALEGMMGYVREVDFLSLTATCENPLELLPVMDAKAVDLVFLDIQMPKMNGIEFLKILQKPPMVIITTAYPSYALEGFQLNVLDYLLKPVTFERFFKAAAKARHYHKLLTGPAGTPAVDENYFFIKCGNKYEKIQFDDILYIEGMQNYVNIFTTKGKFVTILSLKSLEENLNRPRFIRVHKSYIVAATRIDGIEGGEIFMRDHRIPISRNYHQQVIDEIVKKRLWDNSKKKNE
jgi:two-component system LytT family response regulator